MKLPLPITKALEALGLDVGDHGQDFHFVQVGHDLYQVKLEGWGYECADSRGEAVKAAKDLAREWRQEGFKAGSLKLDGEVWALTWAVNGPLRGVDIDPEDVIF